MLLLFFMNSRGEDISASDIIKKVRKKIDKVTLISAEFVQTFEWAIAGESRENTGKIYIGRKDAFRIQTPEQVIISDGKTVWTIDNVNRQVIIDNLDNSEDALLPRQLFVRYEKDYRVSLAGIEKVQKHDCYHLILMPKNEDVYIQKLEVWINRKTWLTQKVSYLDANDNVTTYLIQNIQLLNQSQKDLFRYTEQPDFEVIDMR